MEAYTFCQSCGMPIDRPELLGIEKDHSKSTIYCKHCYQDGEFTQPHLSRWIGIPAIHHCSEWH